MAERAIYGGSNAVKVSAHVQALNLRDFPEQSRASLSNTVVHCRLSDAHHRYGSEVKRLFCVLDHDESFDMRADQDLRFFRRFCPSKSSKCPLLLQNALLRTIKTQKLKRIA